MFERFADAARNVVTSGVEEAARRGERRIGTDHLLIGALRDPGIAQLVGVDVDRARQTSDDLDRESLASVGIDLGGFTPPTSALKLRRAPFTAGSRDVMKRMLAHTVSESAKTIEPRHLMLALLERRRPDPAYALLEALGVDREAVRQRLAAP